MQIKVGKTKLLLKITLVIPLATVHLTTDFINFSSSSSLKSLKGCCLAVTSEIKMKAIKAIDKKVETFFSSVRYFRFPS